MLNRPEITEELLIQIRQIIQDNPDWSRTRISKYLCEIWDWRVPGGTLKDISCRTMLRSLDSTGLISLPEQREYYVPRTRKATVHREHDTSLVEGSLNEFTPLSIEIVESGPILEDFKSLIDQYHYLGFDRVLGANMKYMIRSKDGIVLACLLFGAAAWKCKDRDMYIEWNAEQRVRKLPFLTNNTRFLILPWVRVPHLASHILSLISHRISNDWEKKYGHPIFCLETFVETDRFKGVCYQASNWINVGKTTGRGRNDRYHTEHIPIKDIYLLPLNRRWKKYLLSTGG